MKTLEEYTNSIPAEVMDDIRKDAVSMHKTVEQIVKDLYDYYVEVNK